MQTDRAVPPPSRRVRIAAAAVVAGCVAVALWRALSGHRGGELFDTWQTHYFVLGFLAAASCAWAALRSRGPARTTWALFGSLILLSTTADLLYAVQQAGGDSPWTSWLDVLYLGTYPLLFAGLWILARSRAPEGAPGVVFDGLAVALGCGLLAWALLERSSGGWHMAPTAAQRAVLVSYPILDLLALGMVAAVLVVGRRRAPALWGLAAYVGLWLVSDFAYAVISYESERAALWTDLGFATAAGVMVMAALSPSATHIADPDDAGSPVLSRYILLTVAATAPAVTAAVLVALGVEVHAPLLVVSSLAAAALLSVRVARVLHGEREARRRAESAQEGLRHLAEHDSLTDLPNRAALLAAVDGLAGRGTLALLFIDLDRFKSVNDTAGHRVGDMVLRQASERIQGAVRSEDRVYRLAGDEFVVLCPAIREPSDAVAVAERILDALEVPFELGGHQWFVGASVGLATRAEGDPVDPEQLVHEGDLAMYEAKRDPLRSWRTFDGSMDRDVQRRHETELALRRAVRDDHLDTLYQPIASLADGRIVGFESLTRWPRAGGVLPASDFVPLAEQLGLIAAIDATALRRACRLLEHLNERFLDREPFFVSVNLSPLELSSTALADTVERILDQAKVDPACLVLELTEGALALDPDDAVRRLTDLHDLGVTLAVDDFGTGHSSLAHLLRFPVSMVKIDRLFVNGLSAVRPESSGAAAALGVARTLGLRTVAEGVETSEQAQALHRLGYEMAQGWLFGRAVSAAEAMRMAGETPRVVLTEDPARPDPL